MRSSLPQQQQQQQQQQQAMSHHGRLARALHSSAAQHMAAARAAASGYARRTVSRLAPAAAAAALGRPDAGIRTSVLQDTFCSHSSSYSYSRSIGSTSRPYPRRLAAYSSDAPAQSPAGAYSSSGIPASPAPGQIPAAVNYNGDAAAMPGPTAVQQQPTLGVQPAAPMHPGAMDAGQMQQLAAQQQVGQLAQVQQQQLPPAPQQVLPLPAVHPASMQQQPLQQQQGPPVQVPVGQQQGMPMPAMQGQQPVYAQAATGQLSYMQPAQAYGQVPGYAVQPPAVGQMPAPGPGYIPQGYMPPATPPSAGQDMGQTRAFSAQAPLAGQLPAAAGVQTQAPAAPAPAAAAASELTTCDFADEWVNCVGLTGTVLHGPYLQQFGATGKVKASMVLGLLARTTGDENADKPRPILVEAWGERAQTLAQQVQPGAVIFLQGHLALDLRYNERSPSHGPALTVKAESWELVTPSTVPEGRAACTYNGEFDGVLKMINSGAGGGSAQQGAGQQQQQQQQGYPKPEFDTDQAMQMHLQGRKIFDIAKALNCRVMDVFPALVDAAEAQGAESPAWKGLLAFVRLETRNKAVAYFNAVLTAVQANMGNKEALKKDGSVRSKVVRDYLLSPACPLAAAFQQQEAEPWGVNRTYDQVRLLMAMIRVGARL